MSVHRTCWTEKVKCCPCLDLPAPANGTSRVCGPHGPRITCAGDVAAGRQVFYSLVVHIAHFINEARGMQPSGMFQMFPRVHKTRPQYFLHLYGLRAGCTDYTLSLKKKKKRKKKTPYGAKCWPLSSFFPDKSLRSWENNTSCKVPETTQIIVVMFTLGHGCSAVPGATSATSNPPGETKRQLQPSALKGHGQTRHLLTSNHRVACWAPSFGTGETLLLVSTYPSLKLGLKIWYPIASTVQEVCPN